MLSTTGGGAAGGGTPAAPQTPKGSAGVEAGSLYSFTFSEFLEGLVFCALQLFPPQYTEPPTPLTAAHVLNSVRTPATCMLPYVFPAPPDLTLVCTSVPRCAPFSRSGSSHTPSGRTCSPFARWCSPQACSPRCLAFTHSISPPAPPPLPGSPHTGISLPAPHSLAHRPRASTMCPGPRGYLRSH